MKNQKAHAEKIEKEKAEHALHTEMFGSGPPDHHKRQVARAPSVLDSKLDLCAEEKTAIIEEIKLQEKLEKDYEALKSKPKVETEDELEI